MKNSHVLPIQLPSPEILAVHLERLKANPDGILLFTVTVSEFENWPQVSVALFNQDERKALKRAIASVRKKRISQT